MTCFDAGKRGAAVRGLLTEGLETVPITRWVGHNRRGHRAEHEGEAAPRSFQFSDGGGQPRPRRAYAPTMHGEGTT
jgi:hypothetical protein